MNRTTWWGVATAIVAGCTTSPATPAPKPAPAESPPQFGVDKLPAPHEPPAGPAMIRQSVDLTIIEGPETMVAGKSADLTARVMVPPGTRVVGLKVTPEKEAATYAIKLDVLVPTDAAAPQPLDVAIPFTPPVAGTYFLDGTRRFAIQVAGSTGGFSTGTTSFLDRSTYTGGAYVPGGSAVTPSSIAASASAALWGAVTVLPATMSGAIRGNERIYERRVTGLQGPSYGRRGQRLTWVATLWTAGSGELRPDLIQQGQQLKVLFLLAPGSNEPIGMPVPHEVAVTFSWIFQDPGVYLLTNPDGLTLGAVTIY